MEPVALLNGSARAGFLKLVCVIAEAAATKRVERALSSAAQECVAAVVFQDPLQRVAQLGGRQGMRRSIGSLYGGLVALFLGSTFKGQAQRTFAVPYELSPVAGLAVTRDGAAMLLSATLQGTRAARGARAAIRVIRVDTGVFCCIKDMPGDWQRKTALTCCQVHIAQDDFVFVADYVNDRIHVLTPRLDAHDCIGEGQLSRPLGVCADTRSVFVTENDTDQVSVFRRRDGAFLRRIGSSHFGSGRGQMRGPAGLCLMNENRCIAVAEYAGDRVSVFRIGGAFARHVGVGVLKQPANVACSAFDELVVSDAKRVAVFSACGELVKSFGTGVFAGVAIHGGAIFARQNFSKCVVYA